MAARARPGRRPGAAHPGRPGRGPRPAKGHPGLQPPHGHLHRHPGRDPELQPGGPGGPGLAGRGAGGAPHPGNIPRPPRGGQAGRRAFPGVGASGAAGLSRLRAQDQGRPVLREPMDLRGQKQPALSRAPGDLRAAGFPGRLARLPGHGQGHQPGGGGRGRHPGHGGERGPHHRPRLFQQPGAQHRPMAGLPSGLRGGVGPAWQGPCPGRHAGGGAAGGRQLRPDRHPLPGGGGAGLLPSRRCPAGELPAKP